MSCGRPASGVGPAQQPTHEGYVVTYSGAQRNQHGITLRVNGDEHAIVVTPRTTLLDALRENIGHLYRDGKPFRGVADYLSGRAASSALFLLAFELCHSLRWPAG